MKFVKPAIFGLLCLPLIALAQTPSVNPPLAVTQTNHNHVLTQPSTHPVQVLVWANEAAVSAFSYSFANYRQALNHTSKYFTHQGWQHFYTALQKSNNLQSVINNKLVVSAVATGAPIVINQGVDKGVYTWQVQMPLLVDYQSADAIKKHHLMVTMKIQQTGDAQGVRGLGISQFRAEEVKPPAKP